MTRSRSLAGFLGALLVLAIGWSALATDAQMFFSADKSGNSRVTRIQEGDSIWIVVFDPDENTDCDVRDKFWTDVKLMDPKTGAYIVWESYLDADGDINELSYEEAEYVPYQGRWPGATAGWLGGDYLEETGADTGVFVSKRAFQVGTRESFSAAEPWKQTHVVDNVVGAETDDFRWGHYDYADFDGDGYADNRGWFGAGGTGADPDFNLQMMLESPQGPYNAALPSRDAIGLGEYLIGRFENMDTLIGMVQDPNDASDVAIALLKIIDTEATISWDREIYKDANAAATITVVDADENLDCNQVEYVPVFILVNPGSWNPVDGHPDEGDGGTSPTNFCMLLRTGGVRTGALVGDLGGGTPYAPNLGIPIRWYNIYHTANADHRTYIQYDPAQFDMMSPFGIVAVSFYAQETGVNTGVFQLNLNSILADLGFKSMNVRDVLVAYYLDPNDFDDFKLATSYIEERQHSVTSFTDANRVDQEVYWIGRDPIYVQVIDANANVDPCCPEQVVVHLCDPHGEDDAEWLILDEASSNSSLFFTYAGTQLWSVWNALGLGLANAVVSGFQLQLDNWKIEAFNEDDVMVRYNDVAYSTPITTNPVDNDVRFGLAGLGDGNVHTSFPPAIAQVRVGNDVSFDWMSIADTQVFDGTMTQMYFLDRQGNRVSGYAASDCVFIEVIDPDQDEDPYRRERIDGFWDGGQNIPFGPKPLNEFGCNLVRDDRHPVNVLLGDTNIFNNSPDPNDLAVPCDGEPKIYVLNPRSGRWAAVDLLETGVASGGFVSAICIDLMSVHSCVPTLDVLPGDTILAAYQDPSNHSDSAWISIKVGIGGGTQPNPQSTTTFVDADGMEVGHYVDSDLVYVKVVDPSHAGAALLAQAVDVAHQKYDLNIFYDVQTFAVTDTFMTDALDLDLVAGESITASYIDPTDPTDTSSDTVAILFSMLEIDEFYAAPNPFDTQVTFGFRGAGVASTMTVIVYNLAGERLWEATATDVTKIVWDGIAGGGKPLANGAYLYVITASDGATTFLKDGKIFIMR